MSAGPTLRTAAFATRRLKLGRPPVGRRPANVPAKAWSWPSPLMATSSPINPITPGAKDEGDIDALALWSGQGVGLVRRIQPAAEIVHEIWHEARATLARLQRDLSS